MVTHQIIFLFTINRCSGQRFLSLVSYKKNVFLVSCTLSHCFTKVLRFAETVLDHQVMTYSNDFKARAVLLLYYYDIRPETVHLLLGPSTRTLYSWLAEFERSGAIENRLPPEQSSRWPPHVLNQVKSFIEDHPCAYLEEIQEFLHSNCPQVRNASLPTICRALRFDLNLTRKKLTKHAREARVDDITFFYNALSCFYSFPEQLVFADETSKDGRSSLRNYAWSLRGHSAIVNVPFRRGKRVSILAALNVEGFLGWGLTEGTFDRQRFHDVMIKQILPRMNPYPAPSSILILDNAKIHVYQELLDAAALVGVVVIFLPPYCPHLNPIEFMFGLLKKWIQKHANVAFGHDPVGLAPYALTQCTKGVDIVNVYRHCGYWKSLDKNKFTV